MMIGKLICWWRGHERMRRAEFTTFTCSDPSVKQFYCPRCGKETARKVYARKAKS